MNNYHNEKPSFETHRGPYPYADRGHAAQSGPTPDNQKNDKDGCMGCLFAPLTIFNYVCQALAFLAIFLVAIVGMFSMGYMFWTSAIHPELNGPDGFEGPAFARAIFSFSGMIFIPLSAYAFTHHAFSQKGHIKPHSRPTAAILLALWFILLGAMIAMTICF